ncbi:protealysin inhibitor emfourin [Massilia sp. SM-13]|uniref:protealysin inhibitor emfourin n=1 Tax=Pseudoduganella rhizocola TaxID=3382643 RepID=UPI0038B663BD
MKITVTGSGGFAGIVQQHVVDTGACAAGPALEAAVRDSGFFDAPAASEAEGTADSMRWVIRVDDQDRSRSLQFADGSPDAARWQPLLSLILAA